MTILAASTWPTNGHLIADVATLYFKPDDVIVDLTYGRGRWWTKYDHPGRLVACKREFKGDEMNEIQARGHDPRILPDFRDLTGFMGRGGDKEVDVFAFDPPYMAPGGRSTSTIPDFNDRYGLVDCAASPEKLHEHNAAGLIQCSFYVKPGGLIVTKCMDYISSGKMQAGTFWMQKVAAHQGLELVDRFEHVGHVRQQPAGRRQVHARRNLSTLLIFRKARR